MADVRAFRGVRYNLGVVKDMSKVVSPPYDVISPEFQEELYERSEHAIVRIDFGKEQPDDSDVANKYTRSAEQYAQWRNDARDGGWENAPQAVDGSRGP